MIRWRNIKYKTIKVRVSDSGSVIHKGESKKKYDCNGYWFVSIGGKGYPVHHLVCKAFKSNYTYSCTPNHLDANKKNNNASNLRCGTRSDNTKHAYKLGLVQKGRELWKDVPRTFKIFRKRKQHE